MLDKINHENHHIYEKENDIYVIIIVTLHAYIPPSIFTYIIYDRADYHSKLKERIYML
jgi:hypothetical protein